MTATSGEQGTREHKLQELLDKQEIMELIYAFCNAMDRHDQAKARTLYHPDARDDHGVFSQGLAQDFLDKLPQIQESMEILHHNITTINLKLDGDYAEGEVYLIAFHKVRKEGGGAYDLLVGGRYFDKYEKRDGAWKFTHRAIVTDWTNIHDPSIADLDHPVLAGSYFGKPGPDDPSYKFFSLFEFGQR